MVMMYILVALSAFFDMHFIFYLVLGVCGYFMGESRNLRNVLSLTLRHIDLKTNVDNGEGQLQSNSSDATAMQRLFGNGWRLVWSRVVDSLYFDNLISDSMATKMVAAAYTVRWSDVLATSPALGELAERVSEPSIEMEVLSSDFSTVASTGLLHNSVDHVGQPGIAILDQRFLQIRFRATSLRMASWQLAGPSCCISSLHVQFGPTSPVKTFPQSTTSCQTIVVSCLKEYEELAAALDRNLCATDDLSKFGLRRGWQLFPQGASSPRERKSSLNAVEAEVGFMNLVSSSSFPIELTFVDPTKFLEVVVVFQRPRRLHAVSFSTGMDDPRFDPVRWEIEASCDGNSWCRVQTQDDSFDPPLERGRPVGAFFGTEPWRSPTAGGRTSFDLHTLPLPVSERLCFFANSLRGLLQDAVHVVTPGKDTLTDCMFGSIPTLTQVIPVFKEQVILSEDFLRAEDGRSTNLAFMISQHVDEWRNFSEKQHMDPLELYSAFVSGNLCEWAGRAQQCGDVHTAEEIQELLVSIRLWASNRSQTLARTVAGAIRYHEALEVLPCVRAGGNTQKAVTKLVQLIIAHQTFGKRTSTEESDNDVCRLMRVYRSSPVFLCIDYDASVSRDDISAMLSRFLHENSAYTERLMYASLLCTFNDDGGEKGIASTLKIVEVLPRCYPLQLDEENVRSSGKKSQGKAANQLGALRFARGHYLQMLDANMGAFMGEAFKVPFVLRRFQPSGTDRRSVQARIIGFREHIFTGRHGTVGKAMADAEWTFGTINQRFLAGIGARMHYGHPDFFDAFWASNRGSMSKASPVINLSEDIFAGFNVRMRGERSKHVDCLEWEKGREVSFNSASVFFTKVSSGSVSMMRSRDLKTITDNLGVFGGFSFYFASAGFYISNMLIDLSMQIYVVCFVCLTLAGKDLDSIGQLGSNLAAEWILSFAVLSMLPRFMEMVLEYGVLEGIVRWFPSVPTSMVLFIFMNKSVASAVSSSMSLGDARYLATGRPNANTHYSWKECYLLYRESHYYPALRILVLYLIYHLVAKEQNTPALPMFVLVGTAVIWIIAPILFCPQPTWRSVAVDVADFWNFCIAFPERNTSTGYRREALLEDQLAADISDPRANLYDVWLKDELLRKQTPFFSRASGTLFRFARLAAIMFITYARMLDLLWSLFSMWLINLAVLILWKLCGKPVILLLFSFLFVIGFIFVNAFIISDFDGGHVVAVALVFETLDVFGQIILLLSSIILRPDHKCTSLPADHQEQRQRKSRLTRRTVLYDRLTEYIFFCTGYQYYVYAALVVLFVDLATQLTLVALEFFGGLHSWWLLNKNLSGSCFSTTLPAYKPLPTEQGKQSSDRLRKLTVKAPSVRRSMQPTSEKVGIRSASRCRE
jgi:hypothetical protein